jgi:hypothetical protein
MVNDNRVIKMKTQKFKSDFKTLIINPQKQDLMDMNVMFEEESSNILYLAQLIGLSDDNSFDTFIFFKKDNETFVWHEYENNAHASYFTNISKINLKDYFEVLNKYEINDENQFFKKIKIHNDYQELTNKITINNIVKKNNKI